ncbi:MAG TPA: acyl-[ACP]--phospholipid O-acyltransferase [Gammaproteobacteria bacterium]|nr:acyl-[ACP]--phospholipid O-acyltransferase [Gammaproteobacteria bacterium]
MAINQLSLLKVRRFLPLFLTQFFGAFNDNVYKNALVILITYTLTVSAKISPAILITIAAGIFILPFFLFSATAGQIADKFDKAKLIRYTKIAEILLMVFAGIAFYLQSVSLLMTVLFLVGTQATFFGPMKYSILPDQLPTEELIAGNALLEAGTYLAILSGTILGGILASVHAAPLLVSIAIVLFAIAGYITSQWILPTKPAAPDLKINFNIVSETKNIIRHTMQKRELSLAIFGISWFWLVGATYLSQFPTYTKNVLGAGPSIVTLFLTFFTLGIGLGSMLCNRLLKGRIHATYVPLAALGMTLFAIDLVLASNHIVTKPGHLLTLAQFLSHLQNWHVLFDLLFLSASGGIYVVPLYAILQYESDADFRSRAVACNNIINALFMVIAAIVTSVMLLIHFSVTDVFILVALANLVVAIYTCNLLPDELIKSFLIWLFKALYRVEVRGLENYYAAGNRVLIVANHTSFLDAALIAAFLPDKLTFAIDYQYAKKRWVKLLLKLVNTFPVDPTNSMAAKSLIEYIRQNKRVVIFPEGRITVTGALMKIHEGPGLIADKARAKLLPVRIEGAQYSPFSYLRGKVKIRWFPKITLTVLKPKTVDLPSSLTGRKRRESISESLYDLMTDTMFLSSNTQETLFQSLLNAQSIHGKKHIVAEDIERKPIHYGRLILGSIVLGRRIAKNTKADEYIGLLLPNSIAAIVTFFGMQAHHRIPAMLNFSTGIQNLLISCKTAQIRQIYTSRRFIDLAELQTAIDSLKAEGIRIFYLEDVRASIGLFRKCIGKLFSLFPHTYYRWYNRMNKTNEHEFPAKPAVVLFTSGSEGIPKGVLLSHQNIQANRFQLTSRVDFSPADRVFNALPMFHAFGLTAATIVPIISGMRVFMYPSPLHYRIVPEVCYDTNTTITFGTDTFLSGYAKYAHPYNFYSIRYIFAGAEKLRDDTRQIWMQKFGIRLFEGYGATEASPVLSTNTAMQYKAGTVGRLLPCIDYQLRPVEGITDGGRLYISGPNVMMGYLFSHTPGVIQALPDGWHDTGDIVSIDEEGYITIRGRAKRFAKIAGEMVSLTMVEDALYSLWSENQHAVLCVPDVQKGEQIVLVTNFKQADKKQLITYFKGKGLPDIALPRRIIIQEKMPVLGSGKVDYQAVKLIIESCEEEPVSEDDENE